MLAALIAMQKEADALLAQAEGIRRRTMYGRDVFTGKAFGKDFLLVLTGVGKANAAAGTMLALTLGADALLNFGLAGGVSEQAAVGSVWRAVRAVQYDLDLHDINGTPVGTPDECATPYFPLEDGSSAFSKATLATGDRMTDAESDLSLLHALGADLRDMEGAAIAHAAAKTGTPVWIYKAVSNHIGKHSVCEYRAAQHRALNALAEAMRTIFCEVNDGTRI